MKISEFLPSSIVLFLRCSSCYCLVRSIADDTSLIGLKSESLLIPNSSITGSGVLEVSDVSDVPDVEVTEVCVSSVI